MRDVYETIINHQSVRSYKNVEVPEEDLHKILSSVPHAPSSINGQQCTVIVVRDKEKKEKIARLSGDQEFIKEAPVFLVFLMDFSRAAKAMKRDGVDIKITESIQGTLIGATDCGIVFGSMMTLAESMGYGLVPIGAIRNNPDEIIEMLKLPKYVYPLLGMCLGVPNEEPCIKPKFSFDTVILNEEYKEVEDSEIDRYNEVIKEHMSEKTKGEDKRNWSEVMETFYSKGSFPHIIDSMKKQGFTTEK